MNLTHPIFILGGGEFASAIAVYLWRCHFPVAMVLGNSEIHLRRSICFAEAGFTGRKQVHDTIGLLINEEHLSTSEKTTYKEKWKDAILFQINNRTIPIFIRSELPDFDQLFKPEIIIRTDENLFSDIQIESAKLVIGLYPYHKLQQDCHISIETRANYWLGHCYYSSPKKIPEFDYHFFKNPISLVNSPLEGIFISSKNIGDSITQNEAFGKIEDIEIRSPYRGQIWGLYPSGQFISVKDPLAMIYDGTDEEAYRHFDFTHRTVAGAVLKEILQYINSSLNY